MVRRTKLTPDPQQEKAIKQIDENLYVTASAGSGKTGVLTDRFIHILNTDKSANIKEIIAITFTEKAANEMKERILQKVLERISELKEDVEPDWTDIERWNKIKNNFRFANISTIHSFCSKIIREHPIEANINPDFEVVDELELGISLGKFVRDSIIQVIDGCKPTETAKQCENLVQVYGLGNTVSFVLELMGKEKTLELLHRSSFTRFNSKDEYISMVRKAVESKKKDYLRFIVSSPMFRDNVEYLLSKDFSRLKTDNAIVAEILAFIEMLRKLKNGEDSPLSDMLLYSKWLQKTPLGKFKDDKEDVETHLSAILNFLPKKLFEVDFSEVDTDESYYLINDLIGVYDFMRYKLYQSNYPLTDDILLQRRNKALLTFDELQVYAFLLLANPENDEILEDIVDSFKYIMVDECQDIDFIQNALIKLLAFSSSRSKPNLFIVGDGKQSIYKFRGADVSTFNLIMKDIDTMKDLIRKQKGIKTHITDDDYSLYTNYRSISPIVDFTNSFFSRLMIDMPEEYNIGYGKAISAHRKVSSDKTSTASIEVILTIEPKNEVWKILSQDGPSDRTSEAKMVADRIAQLISDKGAKPGQIAILMKSLNDAFFFERELYSRNISYQVVQGKGFFNRKEIKDCFNLIKLIERPRDEIALLGVLRSPFCGISDLTLFLLTNDLDSFQKDLNGGESKPHYRYANRLYYRLDKHEERVKDPNERKKLNFLKDLLDRLRRNKDRMKITDLLNTALDESGYRNALIGMPQGEQKVANLKKLIEFVNQIEENKQLLLTDFIEYMESVAQSMESASDASIPENMDSVTIMTIHKSKGLEFDYVFVPEMDKGFNSNKDWLILDEPVFIGKSNHPDNLSIGLALKFYPEGKEKKYNDKYNPGLEYLRFCDENKEQLERKRLMYVAFTRAREHLVVSARINIRDLDKGKPKPVIKPYPFTRLNSPFISWVLFYLGIDDEFMLDAFNHRIRDIKQDEYGNDFMDYETDGLPVRVYFNTKQTIITPMEEVKQAIPKEDIDIASVIMNELGYITATSLITYHQCPRKYFYKFQRRIKETGEGIGPRKGKQSEEDILNNPVSEQNDEKLVKNALPLNMVGNIVHGLLEKYEDKSDFINLISSEINNQKLSVLSDEKHKEIIINHINSIIEEFTKTDIYKEIQASKRLNPEFNHNELNFSFKIGDTVIEGAIDKVYMDKKGKLTVLDYKTNRFHGKTPDGITEEMKEKAKKYDLQLKVYTIAASRLLGRKVDKAQLYFLDVQRVYTQDMSPHNLDEIKDEIEQIINEIQSRIDKGSNEDTFQTRPNRDNCLFCGYWMCEDRVKGTQE